MTERALARWAELGEALHRLAPVAFFEVIGHVEKIVAARRVVETFLEGGDSFVVLHSAEKKRASA